MDPRQQLDLFITTALDPPLRDNRDVMERPFLALSKRRTKPIEYVDHRVVLYVSAPDRYGIATIWDWDLVIALGSHLNDAIEDGRQVSRRIEFAPYDVLRSIHRGTSGRDYRELAAAVRRLRFTAIETTIRTDDGAGLERPFSWLSDYAIPKKYAASSHLTPADPDGDPDPAAKWVVELPEWLYRAICRQTGILAVHPGYFDLRGGIERFIYRLARKAVPEPRGAWNFRLDTLHQISGSTSSRKEFARTVREIEGRDPLPEYGLKLIREGHHASVELYRDRSKPPRPRRGVYLPDR